MMHRNVTLPDFLTPKEIRTALRLWNTDRANFHRRVLDEIVSPAMQDINRKLGQENSPDYIAYAIEYVFRESQGST
jgi:hypothetical protein